MNKHYDLLNMNKNYDLLNMNKHYYSLDMSTQHYSLEQVTGVFPPKYPNSPLFPYTSMGAGPRPPTVTYSTGLGVLRCAAD